MSERGRKTLSAVCPGRAGIDVATGFHVAAPPGRFGGHAADLSRLDCQWQLMNMELLKHSCQPSDEMCELRSYVRGQREYAANQPGALPIGLRPRACSFS